MAKTQNTDNIKHWQGTLIQQELSSIMKFAAVAV